MLLSAGSVTTRLLCATRVMLICADWRVGSRLDVGRDPLGDRLHLKPVRPFSSGSCSYAQSASGGCGPGRRFGATSPVLGDGMLCVSSSRRALKK